MKNIFKFGLVLLIAALVPQLAESIAVMSVDLGSEFMKIAIVKPGVPMEIVLNKESRRKTPLAVSLRGSEREFGENALSQGIKNPKTAYLFITHLLGKSIDNPAVKAYREKYPYYDIRPDETTNTIYFQHDESTKYTPEELLAMILEYARDLAADFSEQSIDAAVITVPAYFNQAERKAVLRAADIANLKILQLINSNVAAGLNYGVFRRKDFNTTGTTVMFFDMGSTGTTATIATFQSVKLKDDFEPNPQLTVRGVGFDRSLGGNAFSLRLAKHLGKLFLEKTKKDVFSSPKATLKIYKEADRVKNILSANTDTMSQVEGLMDDVDFKAKVTREEFEKMCADLFDRIKKPVEDAIKMAELPADEIISVILVGGSTRIPKVQDELLKATNKNELGKNLNTDEAPALGAVYQAAYQSKGYKVKKFYIRDANVYQIVVDFDRFYAEGEEKDPSQGSTIRRVLFDVLNAYPQKKVMTFSRHTHDFNFVLSYGDLKFLSEESFKIMGIQNISSVELKEIAAVFEKHKNEETKGIKVHFKMDDSGIVELDKIDIAFEKEAKEEESTFQKLGNTISSFFGGGNEEKPSEEKPGTEGKPAEGGEKSDKQQEKSPNADHQTANNTTEQAANTTTQSGNQTVKPANQTSNVTLVREQIKFERTDLDYKPITRGEIDDSRAKLKVIKEKEKEKRKRASAINSLETYIFDIRDRLTQDEFIKVSKEDERQKISAKVEEVDAWLSETDQSVETQEFNNRLTELKNVCRDPLFRLNEKNLRPKRLDELKDVINKSVEFLGNVKNLTGEDKPLTEVEWNTLEKLIASVKEWRIKMMNEQAKLPDNEDPKLLANDISDKMEELKREVNYLVSKIKYFRPKTTKKPPTSEKSNSSSSDDGQKQQQQQQTDDKNDQPKDTNSDEKTDEKNSNYDEDIFDKPSTESDTGEDKTTNNPEL